MKIILYLLFPLILTSCVTDTTAMIQAEVQQRVLMQDRHDFDMQVISESDLPEQQKLIFIDELETNYDDFVSNSNRQIRWLNAIGEFDFDVVKDFFISELPVEAIREILTPPEVDEQ